MARLPKKNPPMVTVPTEGRDLRRGGERRNHRQPSEVFRLGDAAGHGVGSGRWGVTCAGKASQWIGGGIGRRPRLGSAHRPRLAHGPEAGDTATAHLGKVLCPDRRD